MCDRNLLYNCFLLTKRNFSSDSSLDLDEEESLDNGLCVVCNVYPLKERYKSRKNINCVAFFRENGVKIADEDCWKICDGCRKHYERGVPLGASTREVKPTLFLVISTFSHVGHYRSERTI